MRALTLFESTHHLQATRLLGMSAMMKLARSSSCPSKITLTVATFKRCGNCGVLGHNRRSCGVPAVYAAICKPTPAPVPAHKTNQKRCAACGVLGHNRRTCEGVSAPSLTKTKTYTTTQLFARLPNYIAPEKEERAPALEGLKGCKGLFREPKTNPFPPAAERRSAASLLQLLS